MEYNMDSLDIRERAANLLRRLTEKRTAGIAVAVLVLAVLILIGVLLYVGNRTVAPGKNLRYVGTIPTKTDDYTLDAPLGITIWNGRVYVANGQGGEIVVFNTDGDFLSKFPVKTRAKGEGASYPVGVAVDEDGRIYVTEMNRSALMIFGPDGHYVKDFVSKKKLGRPLAVTYADRKLYVSDTSDQTIKVFDLEGKLQLRFGRAGGGAADFAFPNAIAVGEDGAIYVADSNNARVQIFDLKGRFKRAIRDKLSLPRGIAVDRLGRMHVADTFGRRIVVLETDGEVVASYGKRENVPDEEQLGFPNGIAFDQAHERFFITDRLNNRIEIWSY